MLSRQLANTLAQQLKHNSLVRLYGPHASGKSTLARQLFPAWNYLSLADAETRHWVQQNPLDFFQHQPHDLILDDLEWVPELLDQLPQLWAQLEAPSRYRRLLIANQEIKTRRELGARFYLLPLSYTEVYKNQPLVSLPRVLYQGFFPRLHEQRLEASDVLRDYLKNFLERDLPRQIHLRDLHPFEKFLSLAARRIGQPLNAARMARHCQVDQKTIRHWLNILCASGLVFLLPPHPESLGKRLPKFPKLYFVDVGLAGFLLDLHNPNALLTHPLFPQLFENFIVAELYKAQCHRGLSERLFFFRDHVGNGVKIILESGQGFVPVDINASIKMDEINTQGLRYYRKLRRNWPLGGFVIHAGELNQTHELGNLLSFKQLAQVEALLH